MTQDLNKGITISYNDLNLPASIATTSGNITYLYAADGVKQRVVHGTAVTDYCGNFVYENGTLDKILTEEGYITMSGTIPTYHYYLQDHEGNNHVVINQSGTVEQVNHYYPFGTLFAESTNDAVQKYKYNGKELDRQYSLNLYDYGARYYDSVLGQWTAQDPMAEKYYDWSSYVYSSNNPRRYVDPNGEEFSDFVDKNSNLITHIDDGSNAVFQQTGSGTSLHYSFIGYNDQDGENGVTSASVTSAIQEQQILNMENSALMPHGGNTFCNFATQNIMSTVQSFTKEKVVIFGNANNMGRELLKEKNGYIKTTEKIAEQYAKKGGLAVISYVNSKGHGHIATFSVGKNITKGVISNIGPEKYIGFVSINNTISKNKHRDYFIFSVNYYVDR